MSKPTATDLNGEDDCTTAVGLARYAFDYLEAALVVDERLGRGPEYNRTAPVPAYYLLTHAVELTLKAFLRHNGVSVRDLSSKKFGHNLQVCYDQSVFFGLDKLFSPFTAYNQTLSLMVQMNEGHQLRYIKTGPKTFPYWRPSESFAVRLHQVVSPHVGFPVAAGRYPEIENFNLDMN